MLQTYSIVVTGKVQGVFFRQSTREKAIELGVHGTVMNRGDDTVLIIATGTPEALSDLVNWCHDGPPRAKVSGVSVTEIPLREFGNFTVVKR